MFTSQSTVRKPALHNASPTTTSTISTSITTTAISTTSTSSLSPSSSLPSTPRRPLSRISNSVGLLTPSSSKLSLSPHYKEQHTPPSPALTPDKSRRSPPSRHLFFPIRASLELHTRPVHGSPLDMPDNGSRPGSPTRRSRALSPRRPDTMTRPPSRCESLLRDALRRADEQERSLAHRTLSRSPGRWSRGRSRPRGNSFLEALRRDDSVDSDCDCDENTHYVNGIEGMAWRNRAQAMAMPGRGASSASSGDVASLPYGSPSSPTPMPPSMTRTRTSPTLPRVKRRGNDDEQRAGHSHHAQTQSPQSGRRSLPNTVSHSHASLSPSSDASPKQRSGTLSPHESVLRAKLEYVLQKAAPPAVEESAALPELAGHKRRNHHRAHSHNVTVVTSAKHREGTSSNSSSPQSLAPSSLSNSVTDLARAPSIHSQRRDSLAYRTSSSSPSELLTPPPTPPFNARAASEVCKRIDGYVSFASVEGLGEPPGLDIDSDESEEGLRRWGRWFRALPVPFLNGAPNNSSTHEGGQLIVTQHRFGPG